MKCPVCGFDVDDDDYWAGDKCLRCALEEEKRFADQSTEQLMEKKSGKI